MAHLSAEQHKLVTDAVAAVEATTSGEIVTIVAERSDGYSDVALVWSAIAAFTAIALPAFFADFYFGKIDWLLGQWNEPWSAGAILGLAVAVGILKFAGVWLIQLWQPLKFLLIPGPIKTRRVRARAIDLFKVGAESRTRGRTGVLIYLSLREHRAEIVADAAIAIKVPPETWGDAMHDMLAEIRQGRVGAGMAEGVKDVGAVLAEHFPRDADDSNELPDRLIEL